MPRGRKPIIDTIPQLDDKKWVEEQYVNQAKTGRTIASELGCHSSTFYRYRSKHGIPKHKGTRILALRDKDWLQHQYAELGKTMQEIADEIGCSVQPVAKALHRLGIEICLRGKHYSVIFTKLEDAEWLAEQYVELNRTDQSIGDELGCTRANVQLWRKKHGIQGRRVGRHLTAS